MMRGCGGRWEKKQIWVWEEEEEWWMISSK